jgi:hypothetical protein
MALSYPLYDELVKRSKARSDKGVDIKRLCATINNISQTLLPEQVIEHYREIAALIYHHSQLSGIIPSNSFPYEGKTMVGGKGLLFYIINFPADLQQIITQYVEESSTD